jgi:hypothetical protein
MGVGKVEGGTGRWAVLRSLRGSVPDGSHGGFKCKSHSVREESGPKSNVYRVRCRCKF